ncbi:MAG: adenosine deaminase [Acidimicrobiia bacterium]
MIDLAGVPKAELHLHIEGTLEPELMFSLAERNGVALPYADVDAARAAYVFDDLQSFLDLYYAGCSVLRRPEDFFDLTLAYARRAVADGVRHAEIFFDPQTHTARGVPMGDVVAGITGALDQARRDLGVSSGLILCFLRHLSADDALATWEQARPFREHFVGVGLDSGEAGNPPSKFTAVFARARADGLHSVAHAGEEGPAAYVAEALDLLRAERVDHGVRCLEDPDLVARLVDEQVPLTVCPLSNVKLRVVPTLADHPLRRMLDLGLSVSVNSDDPAYFGGYVRANYEQTAAALALDADAVLTIARNSFRAAFLPADEVQRHLRAVDGWVADARSDTRAGPDGRETAFDA